MGECGHSAQFFELSFLIFYKNLKNSWEEIHIRAVASLQTIAKLKK